jgi:non-ribosomal peptide synthetase component F
LAIVLRDDALSAAAVFAGTVLGHSVLVLDPATPPARNLDMIRQARAGVVLVNTDAGVWEDVPVR